MGNDPIAEMRDKAILCRVVTSAFGAERVDQERSTADFKVKHNVLRGADHTHKLIVSTQVLARRALNTCSLPYGNEEGWRILPYANFGHFAVGYNQQHARYQELYAELVKSARAILDAAPSDASVVAGVPQLLRAYSLNYIVQPFPTMELPGAPRMIADTLLGTLRRRLAGIMDSVVPNALMSMHGPLTRLNERITALTTRAQQLEMGLAVGRKGELKETATDEVTAAIANLSGYSFGNDVRLATLIGTLRPLDGMGARELRASKANRDLALSTSLRALRYIDECLGLALPRSEAS